MENLALTMYFGGIVAWFIVLGYVTSRQLNKRNRTTSKRDFTYYSPNKK
jgi:hypothetical protein